MYFEVDRILNQWCRIFAYLASTIFLLLAQTSLAQSTELPSVVSFEGGGDAEGSRDRFFDLDYGFSTGMRFLLSSSSNTSDSQGNPITTRSISLGFRTDPLARVSGGVDVEHWGEAGTLVTDTLRVVLDVSLQHWLLSFRPQWRTLTFTLNCTVLTLPSCGQDVDVHSTGVALDATYFSNGPWSFSLGFAQHDYDKKVEALGQYPISQLLFSAATLDLATGLEERRSRVGVTYTTGDSLWGYSWLRSVSKVSGEATLVNTVQFSTNLSEQWRLRLRLGSQGFEHTNDRVGFAGAGVAYSW